MKFKWLIFFAVLLLAPASRGAAAKVRPAPDLSRYEGRTIERVELEIEGASLDEAALAELRTLLRVTAGTRFSVVLARESLQALFDAGRVANARVEASDVAGTTGDDGRPRIRLRFVVRPQVLVGDIRIELPATPPGTGVSADEIRGRLNLLEPGRRVSEAALKQNADLIQVYLRDRGFYRATVEYEQQLDATRTRETIIYRIAPGDPTLLEAFNIKIEGFDAARLSSELKLQPGVRFTQQALGEDIARLRQAIIAAGFLAPRLGGPDVRLDSNTNRLTVNLGGSVGPKVLVSIVGYELKEKQQRELLPIKREGTIDPAAIEEGERRIRNRLQEQGYFFAEVLPSCAVNPPLPATAPVDALADERDSEIGTCELLNPDELTNRTVTVTYTVERGRRFKLTDIRIEGTNKLALEDVRGELRTREATVLGIIPFLGYGRGYTSEEALVQDQRTIAARMRDFGYRGAVVESRRGVSLEGENLIVTFVVNEGALTRVADIEVRGNQIFTAQRLLDERCPKDPLPDESCLVREGPFSRTVARADGERLRNFYARNGYFEADVETAVIDLPRTTGDDERVRLVYTVTESDKVFINRIVVNGVVQTKKEAILRAIPIREGEVLRADQLTESERVLLSTTDAFAQVIIRTEQAGENASGFKRRDVLIDVEERKRITTDYIVGYSTDNGPLGGFELRNSNLFGELRQGSLRTRFSGRQQLVQLEYFDPRFRPYGAKEFAPLTLSVQYQRDTSVTRFFRSTIDRGAMGLVQRFDEDGKLIDEFGQRAKEPSINRFTFNAETQRDLELVTSPSGAIRKRSTVVLRYNYEDVRLLNIESLLIAPVLRADQSVRLSRLGASFARDTRDRQFDPTRGDRLSVDYSLAAKALGGNISFNKLLTSYQRYYKFNRVRETVLAANIQFGLAKLFSSTDRDGNGVIDESDRRLPISERFFSGGSTTLRGFGFEEAGPRVVVPDCLFGATAASPSTCGTFRNEQGDPVQLNPFTVPIGGNALAVVNLEARVGLTRDLQIVPFYDGGNVFESVKDIFGGGDQNITDPRLRNLSAKWTHTAGLGFRFKTPFGALGVDYGYLLNPPEFLIPQADGTFAIQRLKRGQLHFRFGQTF